MLVLWDDVAIRRRYNTCMHTPDKEPGIVLSQQRWSECCCHSVCLPAERWWGSPATNNWNERHALTFPVVCLFVKLTLTKWLLMVYILLERWHFPSFGRTMPPSFPSPAKWNPASVEKTRRRVTFLQPISFWGTIKIKQTEHHFKWSGFVQTCSVAKACCSPWLKKNN